MLKKSLKSLATTLGICSVLVFLWWCNKQIPLQQQSLPEDQVFPSVDVQQTFVSSWDTLGQSSVQTPQKLVIRNGCIGCGRCARIAGNAFSFQWGHAQVISQTYNDTPEVQMAIDRCPVYVIEKISV